MLQQASWENGQALAQCLGTLVLVMFGCGAVAQLVLSRGSHGTFLTVNLAFGFAATLGLLVSGQISGEDGGHLNPAVTFSLCLLGREPWRKLPLFFFFQTLGAFLGAAIVFGMYVDALWGFSHGKLIVVGTNATDPSKHLTLVNGFFDQVTGTWFLSSLNMEQANTYWFFVPICAPFLGAVVSVLCYQLMIGYHLEGEVKKKQEEEEEEERLKHSSTTTNEDA
ncbi:aquaporin-3-like [Cyclopterus lumpus]|uniref:aquaporin-3-like n=1 Tax=Cyclopterus lumpus TaxID=8103 RepID=UPI001486D00A|nr:aquaporin-3-like [Cyclopterus lumpus]